MLNENIKKARKEKGFSQEELALKLNVVRQTVSKWESGLSVPDAEVLIRIADILDVPVSRLLDIEPPDDPARNLPEELARVNRELADKNQKLKQAALAGEKRGLILLLSFASMVIAIAGRNELFSLILITGCVLAALVILYRNLALLTSVTTDDIRLGPLRITTLFNILLFAAVAGLLLLNKAEIVRFSAEGEKLFVILLVCVVMLFCGYISPKLPFNRHTGLRLPWTVRDEETWNVAHRILGILSLPLVLLFLAASFLFADLGAVIITTVFVWVGIPGTLSGIFYWKKFH